MTITGIIIFLTVLTSFYAWSKPELYQKLMMNPYRVRHHNEYYRFITSGFIHGDYVHLGFNMLAFYLFGDLIEQILGSAFFLALYLLGIIISDIPTYLKHRNNYHYNSLGASGGVSAIIFSFILFFPTEQICLYFILCLPSFIFGALYMIYSYYQAQRSADNINHHAHLYGAVFGIVFTVLIYPEAVRIFWEKLAGWGLF